MQPSDQKSIRDLVAAWSRHKIDGNLPAILDLMTEDALFLTPGNPPMTREIFRTGFENMVKSVKVVPTSTINEITIEGDMAVCWANLEIAITPTTGGPTRTAIGTTLTALRRGKDGQWRIFRDANMLSAFTPRDEPSQYRVPRP